VQGKKRDRNKSKVTPV